MKPLATILAALLLAPAVHAGGAIQPLLISFKGTAESQVIVAPEEGRIEVTKIDNNRLFEMFNVSKEAYALIVDFGTPFAILFRQKNADGNLPDVVVAKFDTYSGGADTKEGRFRISFETTSPATGNLFEGLVGHTGGTLTFKGPITNVDAKKATFSFIGQCRNIDPMGPSPAFLRFKFRSIGEF